MSTKSGEAHPDTHEGAEAVEAALAGALAEATKAGRWDVVSQLARELEARRQHFGANVVDLAARRRGAR